MTILAHLYSCSQNMFLATWTLRDMEFTILVEGLLVSRLWIQFYFQICSSREVLDTIVKFCHFWPRPLGLCKSDKNYEINN